MIRKTKYLLCFTVVELLSCSCCIGAPKILGLDVVDANPLSEATKLLSEQLECVITYESPPFVYQRELNPIYPGANLFVPNKKMISFDYESTKSNGEVINELIDTYQKKHNVKEFSVSKSEDIFHIIPVHYKDFAGNFVSFKSILDTKISLSIQNQSLWDAFNNISNDLSKRNSKYDIKIGSVPKKALKSIFTTIEIHEKPAREILNHIINILNLHCSNPQFLGLDKYFTWQLMFGTASINYNKQIYYISIQNVKTQKPISMKMLIMSSRPMADAAKVLEKRFLTVIAYEDPPYACPCDLLGNEKGKSIAGGIIKFEWNLRDSAYDTLSALIANRIVPRPNLNVFALKRQNETYYIYPEKYNNEEGDLEPYQSMMNQEISFQAQSINGLDFLRQFCSEISLKVNKMIEIDPLTKEITNKLKQHQFSEIIIEEQPTWIALTQVLHKIEKDISWQLHYDPMTKQFKLSLHEVGF